MDERTENAVLDAIDALDPAERRFPEAARPFLEAVTEMPYALQPMQPGAEVKDRLMAEVAPGASVDDVLPIERAVETSAPGASSGWLKIAAVLAVALLGVSVKQYFDLREQGSQIESQASKIELLEGEIEGFVAPAAAPAWMAASGTEICALRPKLAATEPRPEPKTRGWLFVRSDHQHWYVAVEGLDPCPEGYSYELWFLVDEELVSGGRFHPDAGGRATLTSETMPNPVTGIAITLEPDNGDSGPSENMILWGDEVMVTL